MTTGRKAGDAYSPDARRLDHSPQAHAKRPVNPSFPRLSCSQLDITELGCRLIRLLNLD